MILAMALFGVTIQERLLLVVALPLLGVFSFIGLRLVNFDRERSRNCYRNNDNYNVPYDVPKWHILLHKNVIGVGIPQISTDLIILIIFGIVMLSIAVPLFKKIITR